MKTAFITTVAALSLALASASASILEEGGGIVYGENYAFSLKAPKGWMLDNETAVGQGFDAVFYPKGSTWEKSVVVAYARAQTRTKEVATADDAAKEAIADFRAKGMAKYDGKRVKTIKTKAGKEGVIYHFSGDKWGNYEAMVYFVEEKTINLMVLNARNRKAFEAALPAFDQLAESYGFMGDAPLKGGSPGKKEAAK
ncbi:MAG: hypothetical protein P4L99_18315 [Chthoniobacter sp.]|nr:hypothetical protein [Chthoniobacter sp.]